MSLTRQFNEIDTLHADARSRASDDHGSLKVNGQGVSQLKKLIAEREVMLGEGS